MSKHDNDSTLTLQPHRAAGTFRLVVDPDSARPESRELTGTVVVGKGPDAHVRVDDATVSRLHAELRAHDGAVDVIDLDSRNGTFVNGVRVTSTTLTDEAVLTLGRTTLVLERIEAEAPTHFGEAVGSSEPMRKVFNLLRQLAPTELGVMLIGETGTGKDVLARGLHTESSRVTGPFEVFDCGAVAANLIESELFGHVKGAFTGATSDRLGVFERAHSGTVFLDEVGELPLELQPKLLRVLEQRRVRRLGGSRDTPVDVRVVAATNRELSVEVEQGRFRSDLFFRLSQAVVHVPPLRERPGDIEELARTILQGTGRRVRLSDATLGVLRVHDWPGNVRELKNVVQAAAAFVEGTVLEPRHLMLFPRRADPTLERLPLAGRSLQQLEQAAIKQTLMQVSGNKTRAASVLGIAPSTLYEKIKKYGL